MRITAIGPSREGCHDLPEIDPAEFHRLGGEDIQVWDTDYIIDATSQPAIDYVVNALGLTCESESPE